MSQVKRKNSKKKNTIKSQTRERKKHSKIPLLLLLLLLTTLTLSFSSYAWFSTNRLVRVDLLDVKVRAQGGIEISTDGTTWKAALTIEDIMNAREKYPNSENQIPKTLEPVSSAKEVDNGKLKMFYGTVEGNLKGDYIISASRSIEKESFDDESNGKFIVFDLFLKSNNPTDLYLTPESNITYGGEESVGIENAVRVGFVNEGMVSESAGLETIQNLQTNNNNSVYFWEPNYNTHTNTAIEHAKNFYGITTSNLGQAIKYDGISNEIRSSQNVLASAAFANKYPEYFKNVNIDYYTVNGFDNHTKIFSLQSGITKYRIYMWIEGQDVDCENYASIGNVVLNLQFSTNSN